MTDLRVSGLRDRVAVVTGAGRGIGNAIAETLRDQGARVAAADLEEPDVAGTLGLRMDVTSEEEVDAAFVRIEHELGVPTVLVLNAGIFVIEEFEQTSLASWRRTLDVNLTGAFICARRALPGMRESGWGRVIGMGSSAGKTGGAKSMAAYGASKAGLMTLIKSIASEYASHGITANALAPSLIDTDMATGIQDLRERVPVGRLGSPQEVAELVTFLASTHAGFITGEVVDINGGFLID